jgi:hypothetical protein
MQLPLYIYLYNQRASSSLNVEIIAQYLQENTGLKIEIRPDLIPEDETCQRSLAREFAEAKVIDPYKRELNPEPTSFDIEYEMKLLSSQKVSGFVYDGFCVQEIFYRLIDPKKLNLDHLHIIFTSRLFATFEDNRYHARVAVFGSPSVISTTGIVEAPAKPREFYLRKQYGEDYYILKEEFKGRFIDYDDSRLTDVAKGYVIQALFYHVIGNPFCEDINCRLYNAHWQEEVIKAQLAGKYEFCKVHEHILSEIYNNTLKIRTKRDKVKKFNF